MIFMWTHSTILSKKGDFITYFLKEPVGHFGIGFSNKMVIHWSFRGFRNETLETFLKTRELVYMMDFDISEYREDKIYNTMVETYKSSSYDYWYLLWLIWRGFLLVFGVKIPYKCPKKDMPNNMICHEAIEGLPKDVRPAYDECRANTPYRLYLELLKESKDAIPKT